MPLPNNETWVGRAICSIVSGSTRYDREFSGAYLNFACAAENVSACVDLAVKECEENDLLIIGFEFLECVAFMDRELSEYERGLVEALPGYPVQFVNVHLFKPDS
jgi:hypothetical protein